jgi:hypothetical protein
MRSAAKLIGRRSIAMGPWLGMLVALAILLQGMASAGDPCERRPLDPRSARLQVVDIHVTADGVSGSVKHTGSSSDTAIDVVVWVNYYLGTRGGIIGQQCILVGDIRPGEERDFTARAPAEAGRARAFDTAVAATEWR